MRIHAIVVVAGMLGATIVAPIACVTLVTAVLCVDVVPAARALPAVEPLTAPESVGDQVVFYYDARDGYTTFINVRNAGATELTVSVLLYGPAFGPPFSQVKTVPAIGVVVLDVGALKANGLAAEPGVAIVTAIEDGGTAVVSKALSGNFTVANLRTHSAWGAAGAARSAIDLTKSPPKAPKVGTTIDGTDVVLPPIQPTSADLALYYNPDTLAPASLGGNELVFVAFEDVPGAVPAASLGSATWTVAAVRNTGAAIGLTTFVASGVTVSDVASVAGAGVSGASGALSFTAARDPKPVTRLVFFSESLGTFATGYLLPSAFSAASSGSFLVTSCTLSHSLPDDPIVFPDTPGESHLHDFFANRSTTAQSTYESMTHAGTTCDPETGDLAGYWFPALYRNGVKIDPVGHGDRPFRAYYQVVDTAGLPVEPFPPDLRVVAGKSHATTPAENPELGKEIYWGCSDNSTGKLLAPPDSCPTGIISLHVGFPVCWDGVLTHTNDTPHLAYPDHGTCPAGFPRVLPHLILRVEYPVGGDSGTITLSSGPTASIHADFWNTWDQARLTQLVDACLNGGVDCGKM